MINRVNQQPIGQNMALSESRVIARQRMIMVFHVQSFFSQEIINYFSKQIHVFPLLFHQSLGVVPFSSAASIAISSGPRCQFRRRK